ncbi:MAG: hypothetical protein P4L44_01365 [Oryzomonas sp.]|uniref:hypothetical protein n=1 Tax=Oryzomonas sp. TaxID=2855186 RepID=UPI00284912F7|nr:hypothetical protein [Oryzomonas sp.]MDR3578591.1 hypothetical protein [Oryzomonas sp.]
MSKGRQGNKKRLEAIGSFAKSIGRRARIACEWCEGKEDLQVWDFQPDIQPNMDTLAMLCRNCRELARGKKAGPGELWSIRNALWSNIPAVAVGAGEILVKCNEPWVRGAIDQSFMDDSIKTQLLDKIRN